MSSISKGCAQFLYDFEDYAVFGLGGLDLRVKWFDWHKNSKGRKVTNGGEHIEKDVSPFYMRFRLHRGKKREAGTEEQFALQAKLDLDYEEDKKIAGELLFARVCRQTCHIHRGPFSDWVRKGKGRLRTSKRNVKSVTFVGVRDGPKELSELACRTNNDFRQSKLGDGPAGLERRTGRAHWPLQDQKAHSSLGGVDLGLPVHCENAPGHAALEAARRLSRHWAAESCQRSLRSTRRALQVQTLRQLR